MWKCDSRNLTLPNNWSRPKHLISNIYKKIIGNIYPGSSEGKASACNAGDPGSIPGSGRFPGGGHGNPLQYSCLKNPMDRGTWWATVHGVSKSWAWLSNFTSLHFTNIRKNIFKELNFSDLFNWSSYRKVTATNEWNYKVDTKKCFHKRTAFWVWLISLQIHLSCCKWQHFLLFMTQ